jgi:mannosyl-oligosaccharide alpha-1,2-mannosidase
MMEKAWGGYVKHSWGQNELKPISKMGHSANVFGSQSMGATIVDAMDTLYIMGLEEEFKKARDWVATNLSFDKVGSMKLAFTRINKSIIICDCYSRFFAFQF